MIKAIIKIFFTLLAVIILSTVFLTMTTPGLKLCIRIANGILPGQLSVGTVEGRLIHSMTLSNIDYYHAGTHYEIKDLHLSWSPIRLFEKRLYIRDFEMDQAILVFPKTSTKPDQITPTKKSQRFSLKKFIEAEIPLQVTAKNIQLTNISIQQAYKDPIEIQKIILQGESTRHSIVIKQFSVESLLYELTLQGNIELKNNFPIKLTSTLIWREPHYKTITTLLNCNGDLKKQLDIDAKITDAFEAHIHATIQKLLAAGPINIQGSWKKLFIPFSKHGHLTSNEGSVTLNGTLKNYQFNLKTNINGTSIPEGDWNITGHGNLNQLDQYHVNTKTLNGTLKIQGSLSWWPSPQWKTQIQMNHINPGIEWPSWMGDINAHLITDGKVENSALKTFSVELKTLSGKLHKHPIRGYFSSHYQNKELTIDRGYFNIGNDFLKIQGELGTTWNFTWNIRAPQITEAFPSATGSLFSQGTIRGNKKTPAMNGVVNIKQLLFSKFRIKQLHGKINLDFKPQGHSIVELNGENIDLYGYSINNITTSLTGHVDQHQLTTMIKANGMQLNLKLNGGFKDSHWQGTLYTFNLHTKNLQNWHLNHPVQMTISKENIQIPEFCWQSNQSKICGQLNWKAPNIFALQTNITNFPTKLFSEIAQTHFIVDSKLNLNANLQQDEMHGLQGTIKSFLSEGRILTQQGQQPIILGKTLLTATANKAGISSDLKILNQNTTPLHLTFSLPGYRKLESIQSKQPIKGSLLLNLQHLTLLSELIPDASQIDGALAANLNLAGHYQKPTITGKVTLKNGQVKIDSLGIKPTDINLSAHFEKKGTVNFSGQFKSTGTPIQVNGKTELFDRYFPTQIKIKGKNCLVMNTNEYKVYVSPDITLTYDRPKLTLTGNITVPKAYIAPKDFTSVVKLPSNAIIISDNDDQPLQKLLEFYLKVKIILKDNVNLDIQGLTGKLNGGIDITYAPGMLTTAHGELNIYKGQYTAYGEKLYIEKGNLIYTGGTIQNPGLNIRAVRYIHQVPSQATSIQREPYQAPSTTSLSDVKTLVVGIQVTGTMERPKLTLFSEPGGLSQSDILSYLMLGFSTNQASGAQAQLLLKAANMLGFGGSNITNSIQSTFGLSNIGIESQSTVDTDTDTTVQNPSVVIGKYITPKIYLNYSLGLMIPISVLHVKYIINKRVTLESETSTRDNGVDLFYQFQTN